jgi:uncharacterized SAM-binding protein YcdF (DUF218 family)
MFFYLSKILWYALNPLMVVLGIILLGWLVSFKRAAAGRWIAGTGFVLLLLFSQAVVPQMVARPLENRVQAGDLPEKVDGIIVLTGGVYFEAVRRDLIDLNDTADRIIQAVILARRHPEARLIITGGSGSFNQGEDRREADHYARLARELGVEEGRIVVDRDSRNTHESAAACAKIIQDAFPGDIVLITSAMHMPRAVGCFEREEVDVIPYPVDYRTKNDKHADIKPLWFLPNSGNLELMYNACREWTGLVMYWLQGYTERVF